MMIAHFAAFCLWLDVVDALWRRLPPTYKLASGPALACSDSEVITMPLWAGAVAGHGIRRLLRASAPSAGFTHPRLPAG
jgi:hypothetical protein